MSTVERQHHAAVTAWFAGAATGGSVDALIRAFENTFAALWQRSHLTLGEVTLTAIVDRVLHTATEKYPLLAAVEVDASGLSCERLRSESGLPHDQTSTALQFVLIEFLTVLGNLTAEILTPALHAELSKGHANPQESGTKDPTS